MAGNTEKLERMERALVDMAVESWRFVRLVERILTKLDAGESGRYAGQLRYFQQKLEEHLLASGLSLVSLEGQPFDPGMAASALNLDEFGPDDPLVVDKMLEPIIMGPEGVRRQGTILLRRRAA